MIGWLILGVLIVAALGAHPKGRAAWRAYGQVHAARAWARGRPAAYYARRSVRRMAGRIRF